MSGVVPMAVLMLGLCIALETLEQIAFKASESAGGGAQTDRLAWHPHVFTGLGIVCYILHMAAWFWVLAVLPLGIALPLMGASYVTVALASRLLFAEEIQPQRWVGIALIMAGLCCVWKVVA